jgi:hypothetical protein
MLSNWLEIDLVWNKPWFRIRSQITDLDPTTDLDLTPDLDSIADLDPTFTDHVTNGACIFCTRYHIYLDP